VTRYLTQRPTHPPPPPTTRPISTSETAIDGGNVVERSGGFCAPAHKEAAEITHNKAAILDELRIESIMV
jgi:hypothetical protein